MARAIKITEKTKSIILKEVPSIPVASWELDIFVDTNAYLVIWDGRENYDPFAYFSENSFKERFGPVNPEADLEDGFHELYEHIQVHAGEEVYKQALRSMKYYPRGDK